MNGVARQYWSEVFDLRLPAPEPELSRSSKQKVKRFPRRILTRRPVRPAA